MKDLFHKQIQWFNFLDELWESKRVSKLISNLVVLFFVAGILVAFLDYLGFSLPFHDLSPFFAIELAFTVLLAFEVLGLIFLLPKSVADSVGKQFEIISLVLLRDAFKEFGHYLGDLSWKPEFLFEILPILSDAFGAILIFFITGVFYSMQRHQRITQNSVEQEDFMSIKKLISIYLAFIFILLGFFDLVSILNNNALLFSIKTFYTLLIYADIFILLFSLRYTSKYFNLFRYSSFALATVFLRLTLSAPEFYNALFAIIAGLMVLGVTFIYNRLLIKKSGVD